MQVLGNLNLWQVPGHLKMISYGDPLFIGVIGYRGDMKVEEIRAIYLHSGNDLQRKPPSFTTSGYSQRPFKFASFRCIDSSPSDHASPPRNVVVFYGLIGAFLEPSL